MFYAHREWIGTSSGTPDPRERVMRATMWEPYEYLLFGQNIYNRRGSSSTAAKDIYPILLGHYLRFTVRFVYIPTQVMGWCSTMHLYVSYGE